MGVFAGAALGAAFVYVMLAWQFGWPETQVFVGFVGIASGGAAFLAVKLWRRFAAKAKAGSAPPASNALLLTVLLGALLSGCASGEQGRMDMPSQAPPVAVAVPPPMPMPASPPPPVAKPMPADGWPGPITDSGRAPLLRGQGEDRHYGLYSYILIRPRDFGNSPAVMALLRAYHTKLNPIGEVAAFADGNTDTLNLLYLPVKTRDGLDEDSSSGWYQKNYDSERAKRILRRIGDDKNRSSGVLIVASKVPLDTPGKKVGRVLVWDVGHYRAEDMEDVMRAFLVQVEQPDFDKPDTLANLQKLLWQAVSALRYAKDSVAVWKVG